VSGVPVGTLPADAVLSTVRSGFGVTVKVEPLVVVPTEFVMAIEPLVAPFGTVAVIEPLLVTVNVALTPLNFTKLEEKKFEPVMVTVVPAGPDDGVNEAMVGAEPGLIFVVTVAELLAGFGSPWSAAMPALALICPTAVGVTTMVTVRLVNAGWSVQLHVTTPPPCEQEPALGVAET
jgi:hypothetical protein